MSSSSHQSYASKLGNAQTLLLAIQEFTTYVAPLPIAEPAALETSILAIQTLENNHNTAQTQYHTKVQDRQNLFDNQDNSIEKLLSPIRTFVQALTSETDPQYVELNKLIKRIRGTVSSNSSNTTNPQVTKKSQVETTFTSRQHDFSLIINILESLSVTYAPPNADISLANLILLKDKTAQATAKVETTQGELKQFTSTRQDSFKALSAQCQTIKNFVKAQFGLSSIEYSRVKSLKI